MAQNSPLVIWYCAVCASHFCGSICTGSSEGAGFCSIGRQSRRMPSPLILMRRRPYLRILRDLCDMMGASEARSATVVSGHRRSQLMGLAITKDYAKTGNITGTFNDVFLQIHQQGCSFQQLGSGDLTQATNGITTITTIGGRLFTSTVGRRIKRAIDRRRSELDTVEGLSATVNCRRSRHSLPLHRCWQHGLLRCRNETFQQADWPSRKGEFRAHANRSCSASHRGARITGGVSPA